MGDGTGIRVRSRQAVVAWLLVVTVGLGVVALVESLAGQTRGDGSALGAGAVVALPPTTDTVAGQAGVSQPDRTPIRVWIDRRRALAEQRCTTEGRVPIAVAVECRRLERAAASR